MGRVVLVAALLVALAAVAHAQGESVVEVGTLAAAIAAGTVKDGGLLRLAGQPGAALGLPSGLTIRLPIGAQPLVPPRVLNCRS
jgi:hypothetical protein